LVRSGCFILQKVSRLLTMIETALLSLNAGREILHVASGTYSRLVPQTPEKFAGQIAGQTAFEGGEVLIP